MEDIVKKIQETRHLVDTITSSMPDRIQIAALTTESKIPFKALSIRELLLHRVSPLATASIDLYERNQIIPAVVLTRAVVETIAVLYSLHDHLERFFDDKDSSELDNFLTKCLVGSRNNPDLPLSINILTFVDRVDKTIPRFRSVYDSLCEYTHPNWAGTLGAFGEIDKKRFELKLGPSERTPAKTTGILALSGAMMIFHQYYNNLSKLVLQLNDYFENGESN